MEPRQGDYFQSCNLLVVDDEEMIRQTLINILEETLTLRIDKPSVSKFLVEFAGHYPAPEKHSSAS